MQDDFTAFREVSDRSWFGKFVKTVFIMMNLLMIVVFTTTMSSDAGGDVGPASKLGFALGSIMLVIVWGMMNLVLGSFVLLTRRKRLIRTEDYLPRQRAEKQFRELESIRGWAIALGLWVVYTSVAGAWHLTAGGLLAGGAILWFFHRGWGARVIDEISSDRPSASDARARSVTFGRRSARVSDTGET
ncbi:MAG TPA: hypothetical protein VF628_01335 [Allosphingosinicella sp.]|jgi:hypothetical protein